MSPRRPAAATATGLGGEQVEGRQAVRELLRARRRRVRDVWMAEGLDASPVLAEITELASEQRVAIRQVGRGRLDGEARTEAPQGVLAHAEPLPEVALDRLAQPTGSEKAFLLVLDGVTDPHNLGALLRTAEVAGATGAVLPRHRSAHITPTVAKASAGAIEHLQLALVPGIPAALARLKELGVWTVGLDGDAPTSLFGFPVATEAVALVLGSEGSGLGRLTRERCDLVVSIPGEGSIGSLNVAAAGAVACFEVSRLRHAQ